MTIEQEEFDMERLYEEMRAADEQESLEKKAVLKQVRKLLSARKYRALLLYLEDGWGDFLYDCSLCNGVYDFKITDEPATKKSFKELGLDLYVNQWGVGDSGDSWEGLISVALERGKGRGKFFTFRYSC